MKIIDFTLNTIAIAMLIGGALWVGFLLIALSIVVSISAQEVASIVVITVFIVWRLQRMLQKNTKYQAK